MKSKMLLLCFLFVTSALFGQNENPYAYNNAIITVDQPTSVKEYAYDYDTQVEKHVQNHTLKYNSAGLLTERIQSSQGIADVDVYQTFRYRFQYDSKSRLIYFWKEQLVFGNYESMNEEQWVYDSNDMIIEHNNWSVQGGTKYFDIHSYKRVITRDANNQVLKIEKSIYTSTVDEDELVLVLDKVYTFKYDANNILDSIIVFGRNITLGQMKLESKQYDLDFKNYNVTNTDLLTYNSYQMLGFNDFKSNFTNTFDTEGRLIKQTEKYPDDEVINETIWTYAGDKITIADLYKKEINYMDATGRAWKRETYTYNGTEWELDYTPFEMYVRTFANNKLTTDLHKNYYDSETKTYKNDTRFEYTYSPVTTGILGKQSSNVVLLYPNPTTGTVYVNGLQDIEKLSISSVTGSTRSLPLQEQIDLSGLAAGVYIITAEFNDQSSSIQRLILK